MPVDNELLSSYVSGARNADDGRVKVIFRTSRDKGQRPWREPGRKHPSSAAGGGVEGRPEGWWCGQVEVIGSLAGQCGRLSMAGTCETLSLQLYMTSM